MKKRAKKRIPQDIKPWVRIQDASGSDSDSTFRMEDSGQKTQRWFDGTRRERQNTVLQKQISAENSKILLRSFIFDQEPIYTGFEALRRNYMQYKLSKFDKMSMAGRSKNFCLFTGRGRTFNRGLMIARHTLRKLMRFGYIPGLKK